MMDDISRASTMEFRPLVAEIGFPPPSPNDPRERKPKADDPDYSQKLMAHEAFNFERDGAMRLLMFGRTSPCW